MVLFDYDLAQRAPGFCARRAQKRKDKEMIYHSAEGQNTPTAQLVQCNNDTTYSGDGTRLALRTAVILVMLRNLARSKMMRHDTILKRSDMLIRGVFVLVVLIGGLIDRLQTNSRANVDDHATLTTIYSPRPNQAQGDFDIVLRSRK